MGKLVHFIKEAVMTLMVVSVLVYLVGMVRGPKISMDEVPDVAVPLVDGSTFKYRKGEPLMIHFWGTWCPVCKMEVSNINTIAKRYQVLTIANNSGSNEQIKQFLHKKGVAYPVFNDQNASWSRDFNLKAYPTTLIYDSNGKLKYTDVGYTTTAGLLARMKMAE